MATGVQTCSLMNVERLTLEETNELPWYDGIVVFSNKILVIDGDASKVQIYGLQDGRLLYESDRLELDPIAVCLIKDSEMALIMKNGLTKIMSTQSTAVIRWTRDLRVRGGLDRYDGVVSFNGDLVVCGVKGNTVCWCVVSSKDGHVVGIIHQICKVMSYPSSFITAKNSIIYISCSVESPDTGVYAYDVQNPGKYKYSYKHTDLESPRGIAIDLHGSLFVCNINPYDCIHHLTSECQLVSIITQGIPSLPVAIFCEDGLLYVTSYFSNHIIRYRTQYPDPIIPSEVLNIDPRSFEINREAPYDVGKLTLTKRLLGNDVTIFDRQKTEEIDVQTECSQVSLATGEWITQEEKKLHQTVLNLRKKLNVGDVMQRELFDDVTKHDISVDKGQSGVQIAVPQSGQRLMDSENGKQDQNSEKDISFTECIKESNFRKIGLLLKNRMIPPKSTIIQAIKDHKYNKGIQCLLQGMANLLRKQIPDAIRVWSGYRTEDIHTPVFVVMFSKKTIIPEKMIFSEPYDDYEIVFRNEHIPNEEEVRISEQSEVNANAIKMEDIARVLGCISENTERLMNEHSNLSIIAASTVKAMGFNGCLSKMFEQT